MDVDVSPSNGFSQIYNSLNNSVASVNPLVLLALTLIIVFYFLVFSYLGYNGAGTAQVTQTPGMKIIEVIMWGLLIFLVLINGLQYFFKIDVTTAIKNLFTSQPEVAVNIKPEEKYLQTKSKEEEEGVEEKIVDEVEKDLGLGNLVDKGRESGGGAGEVFNVPQNIYTYDNAEALCKAYGAELATYDQIESAYKSGAEWCNYGWSADQMAYYPTQKTTWHKLQKIKGHEHDCGRPGINGGYIKNPNVRFGVNCFGSKPKITANEQEIMNKATPIPMAQEDKTINNLVNNYKKKLSSILISPFNYNNWHQF